MIKIKEREAIKLSGLTSFTVEFQFNQQILNAVKGIPGAIWHKKLVCWEIPATSLSYALDNLVYLDDIDLILAEDFEESKSSDLTEEEIRSFKNKPFSHQIDAINYGLREMNHKWLLLDGMGLG